MADREPPHYLMCPITQDLMERPVMAPDNRTYEEEAITAWMRQGENPTSPVTREPMPSGSLRFNYAVRDAIEAWRAEQPLAIDPARLSLSKDVIGRGSFGQVVAGTLRTFGAKACKVAVKTLPDVGGEEARKMFEKELKAHMVAQQGADGVCRLFGTCVKDGRLCLVMKRYDTSLAKRLQDCSGGGLDVLYVRNIAHHLFQTLDQLHRAGVVVKDIKPDNVLLDTAGRPHIADFGISVVLTKTTRVAQTSVAGTFNYLAPEAYDDAGFGVEVDIWAMGCLLLEMLTGQVPWDGLQMQQIWSNVVMMKKIPTVPDHVPEADSIRRCFEYEPSSRPTAAELAEVFNPRSASLPEVVGGMAESFAHKVADLTRRLDEAKRERDEAKRERDAAQKKCQTAQQQLKEAQQEITQLRRDLQSVPITRPRAAVGRQPHAASQSKASRPLQLGCSAVYLSSPSFLCRWRMRVDRAISVPACTCRAHID